MDTTSSPTFLVIDLFCGFGGTTLGYELATLESASVALVFACINHDAKAIKSHWLNNPTVKHFEEDIRTLDLDDLTELTEYYRQKYPLAKLILWASLECTNFSKAKGGLPRDPDSRTLAHHLLRYIHALDPDYVKIENVVEFRSWGPLISKVYKTEEGYEFCPIQIIRDSALFGSPKGRYYTSKQPPGESLWRVCYKGVPESRKNGRDWLRWKASICSLGYRDDWREINSADFGAYTSRNRLFGIFAKEGLPIAWPVATHQKPTNPDKTTNQPETFGGQRLLPWNPVEEVLDLSDKGNSIFNRKRKLSENTLRRILAGLNRFVANEHSAYLSKYFSGNHQNYHQNLPLTRPAGTITTTDKHSLVQIQYLQQSQLTPIGLGLRVPFLTHYYSGGGQVSSITGSCPTITAMDGKAIVHPEFAFPKMPSKSVQYDLFESSTDSPVWADSAFRGRYRFILNLSWGGHLQPADQPCPVLIARQDKAPLYCLALEEGPFALPIYNDESDTVISIKKFMVTHGIVDIKMRMLHVRELLQIQGFPLSYKMIGSQADMKKFIGNSVVPIVVKCWAEALATKVLGISQRLAA